MKKIIWVFGESATGKLTLINNLYKGDVETINSFNFQNLQISICEITLEDKNHDKYNNIIDSNQYDDSLIEEDNLYFKKEKGLLRRKGIMYDVETFLNNDSDILLIKGQINDLNPRRGKIVEHFLEKYGNREDLEIEVYILQVTDKKELMERLQTKKWFKEMKDEEEKEKLLNKIPLKKGEHKEEVIRGFNGFNIPIYIIESSNNTYRIEEIINRKSSSIRR